MLKEKRALVNSLRSNQASKKYHDLISWVKLLRDETSDKLHTEDETREMHRLQGSVRILKQMLADLQREPIDVKEAFKDGGFN